MKNTLKIFILLCVFTICLGWKLCGGRYMNTNRYVCCNNRMKFIGRPGGACCGIRGYNPSSQICCGGRVFRKKNVNTGCCYGKYYQRGKKSCCGRSLINIKTHGCCRNEPFVKAYEDCCDGERVPNFSVNSTDPQQCCGKVLHNIRTHHCCAEKVAPKVAGEFTKCCRQTTYDSRKEACCNREVIPKQPGKDECCHGKMIDSSKQICCDYRIQDRIYGENTDCCRLALYKYTIFNTRTHICCSRELQPRIPKGTFDAQKASRMSCCNQKAYDSKHQICCGLRVHNRKPGKDERCCGRRPYDRSKYICCQNYKWRLTSKYLFCCGRYRYDRRRYQCKLVNGKYKRVSLDDNGGTSVVSNENTPNKKGIEIFLAKTTKSPFVVNPYVPKLPRRRTTTTTTTPNPYVDPFLFFTTKKTLPEIPEWLKGIDWEKLEKSDSIIG